jgi:nucleoside-diphosphate-sugar epimerase
MMEEMAQAYITELEIAITRPFNYTGVGQSENFVVPKIVAHFFHNKDVIKLGNINVRREFNDVRFVTSVYLSLIQEKLAHSEYNICSGSAYTISNILEVLGEIVGRTPRIQIDESLKRSGDVPVVFGDPTRLHSVSKFFPRFRLKDTLMWMTKVGSFKQL